MTLLFEVSVYIIGFFSFIVLLMLWLDRPRPENKPRANYRGRRP